MARAPKPLRVAVLRLPHAEGLGLPAYQTEEAAGLDLLAAVPANKPMKLAPRAHVLVPTGLVMALPKGYEAQVRPRSGLAFKHGVTVLNSPGTIDSDYRGEVGVILVNLSTQPVQVRHGDRIAQLLITPVARVAPIEVEVLDETARGSGGFGHTGRS